MGVAGGGGGGTRSQGPMVNKERPCGPVCHDVYSGVTYEHLSLPVLPTLGPIFRPFQPKNSAAVGKYLNS